MGWNTNEPAPGTRRAFAARVVAWQAKHGRHDLPWQASRDPYRVWLAEVMLQQTQVATAIPYYRRFCARFPDVGALAAAPLSEVLSLWAGLGYYARARNLHACARQVLQRHGGRFPLQAEALAKLPGIGRSTAGAIAAFCAGAREPILDGNVRRVLARHFGIAGDPGRADVARSMWTLARELLPASRDMAAYTQGLMDLGATVCTRRRPRCEACPLARTCVARASGRVEELPGRRARRPQPLRRAWALLAVSSGQVLLQRRAPAGVWGGLLALPQFDSVAALRRAAAALDAQPRLRALPPRRHAFTHFTLELLPRRLDLQPPAPLPAEAATSSPATRGRAGQRARAAPDAGKAAAASAGARRAADSRLAGARRAADSCLAGDLLRLPPAAFGCGGDIGDPRPAGDLLWLPLADIERAPLPAPIRTLLREVAAAPTGAQPSSSGAMSSATRKRDTML